MKALDCGFDSHLCSFVFRASSTVEQVAVNDKVVGSSPTPGANLRSGENIENHRPG